ncbi:MAG: Abi family protein [bacterium]|nr:Abi family protein [Candidatus Colisoma equi]
MLREVSEPDSLSALRQILSIHGRYRGSVDEMWLSGSGVFKDAKTCRDLTELATLRKDSVGAGIALGFQQGFTLGHADLAAAGILPEEMKDVFPYPVDAWAVGRDGKRLENLCARSTDVQKREEEYVEVWRYYRFDRRLKNVVLDGIERVEIATRTKIVNRFTGLYGPFGYRETTNFAAPIDNVRFSKTLMRLTKSMSGTFPSTTSYAAM